MSSLNHKECTLKTHWFSGRMAWLQVRLEQSANVGYGVTFCFVLCWMVASGWGGHTKELCGVTLSRLGVVIT